MSHTLLGCFIIAHTLYMGGLDRKSIVMENQEGLRENDAPRGTHGLITCQPVLIVGVQNELPQDMLLWYVDYFELKATLAIGSRETSTPPITT